MKREQHTFRGGEEGAPRSKGEVSGCRKENIRDVFTLVFLTQGKGSRVPLSLALIGKRETGSSQGRGVTQGVFGSRGF